MELESDDDDDHVYYFVVQSCKGCSSCTLINQHKDYWCAIVPGASCYAVCGWLELLAAD